jgi:hypothetical protein
LGSNRALFELHLTCCKGFFRFLSLWRLSSLFFLLGLWVGIRSPHFMPRLIRLLAWLNGLYGITYILFLGTVGWYFPGVSKQVEAVPIFGLPEFSFVILLGLLIYESDHLWTIWHLLIMNAFVLLGMQIRGEWLAFAVGIFLWAYFRKSLKKVIAAMVIAIVLLGIMFVADVQIPGPESRGGGTISLRDLAGRALAPVNSDLAAKYTSSYQMDVDTTVWRTVWWVAIWQAVHESRTTAVIGFGYGYPLGALVPYLEGEFIQTPHNAFFYALGYGGWLGVLLFGLLLWEIGRLLWGIYRDTGQWAGLVLLPAMFVYAQFTAFFEAPYGAIPFYLLAGALVGAPYAHAYAERRLGTRSSSVLPRPVVAPAAPGFGRPEPEGHSS